MVHRSKHIKTNKAPDERTRIDLIKTTNNKKKRGRVDRGAGGRDGNDVGS